MGLFNWIRPAAKRADSVGAEPAAAPELDFVQGRRQTLERVYRDTFAQVRRAAGSVLSEPADRDAIVQQVYLELIADRKLRESYRGGSLGAFLATIARHRALDFARRERRLVPLDEQPDEAGEPPPLHEFRAELSRFAAQLDGAAQELLQLRFIAGMTQVEAAAALGIPRSTLETREHELKALLRAHLLGTPEGSTR